MLYKYLKVHSRIILVLMNLAFCGNAKLNASPTRYLSNLSINLSINLQIETELAFLVFECFDSY